MSERILVRLLHEIAHEKQIKLTELSHGWLFRLEKNGVVKHVYGNNFDINLAASQKIVSDKAATSEVLKLAAVPHVEHRLFFSPDLENYCPPTGAWHSVIAYAEAFDYKVVCKPISGSGGSDVFFCENMRGLEQATQKIHGHGFVLCPYYEAEEEYRLVMLDGECELAYRKQRPQLVGNGKDSFLELLATWVRERAMSNLAAKNLIEENQKLLQYIPAVGEAIKVSGKHNLSKGALPQSFKVTKALNDLATTAVKALNMRFVSVDILKTLEGLKVLEVNSGVMMDNYVRLAPKGYEKAKMLYCKVIELMLKS